MSTIVAGARAPAPALNAPARVNTAFISMFLITTESQPMTFAFKTKQLGHAMPYGIEHAADPEGETILHCEWFTTEAERDQQLAFWNQYNEAEQ